MTMRNRKYDLESWRRAKGLSMAAAADTLGCSLSYLYYIQRRERKPGRKLLARMTAVGIDPLPFLEVSRAS